MRNFFNRLLFVVSAFSVVATVHADTFHLNISEDTVAVGVNFDSIGENSSADLNWMHDSDFDLYRAGIYVDGISTLEGSDNEEVGSLAVKIGLKVIILDTDFDDGSALPLGGEVEYMFTEKLSFFADAFYASGKLSFDDVDSYQEFSLGVRAKVIENGTLSIAYSFIEVDTDQFNNVELEDGLMFQMALQF